MSIYYRRRRKRSSPPFTRVVCGHSRSPSAISRCPSAPSSFSYPLICTPPPSFIYCALQFNPSTPIHRQRHQQRRRRVVIVVAIDYVEENNLLISSCSVVCSQLNNNNDESS